MSFNGTYVSWLAKKSPVYGKAQVFVDGVDQGTIDLYSAATLYTSVWSKNLPAGNHTVTIAWTGTKNASATDTNISVDAFQILGTISQAPGGSRYQQDATDSGGTPYLHYAGTWSTFAASGASGGSYARANTSGASVTINFNGTYLGWVATKGTTLGKALVSVDGGAARQVRAVGDGGGLSAERVEHGDAVFGQPHGGHHLGPQQYRRQVHQRGRRRSTRHPAIAGAAAARRRPHGTGETRRAPLKRGPPCLEDCSEVAAQRAATPSGLARRRRDGRFAQPEIRPALEEVLPGDLTLRVALLEDGQQLRRPGSGPGPTVGVMVGPTGPAMASLVRRECKTRARMAMTMAAMTTIHKMIMSTIPAIPRPPMW